MRARLNWTGWRRGARAVALLALAATAGCAPYATRKVVPVDCTAQNGYVFDSIQSYFSMYVFTSNDTTPNSVMSATVNPIPDGALCGDTSALEAVATGNNDWGSLFGFYQFPVKHEATMEGLSFWARAPGNTGKAFTLLMDDSNTHDPDVSCPTGSSDAGLVLPPPPDSGIACTTYCTPDAGASAAPPVYDSITGAPVSSGTLTATMAANACGNDYWVVVEVTNEWQFYTIPFQRFSQQRQPNLVGTPNGLFSPGTTPNTTIVTSAINDMIFRFPKESAQDLWIDRLAFYRPGVGDGGAGQ